VSELEAVFDEVLVVFDGVYLEELGVSDVHDDACILQAEFLVKVVVYKELVLRLVPLQVN
jgi:hypothetical protein